MWRLRRQKPASGDRKRQPEWRLATWQRWHLHTEAYSGRFAMRPPDKAASSSSSMRQVSPRFPWENADLCEYLASFGYLALSSPAMVWPASPRTIQQEQTSKHATSLFLLTIRGRSSTPTRVPSQSWDIAGEGQRSCSLLQARPHRSEALDPRSDHTRDLCTFNGILRVPRSRETIDRHTPGEREGGQVQLHD